ncbi:alpha,alpha-trehalase [Winogradskyella alexanderae]|uniref:Trehalase n=1 Tax=Winogradskyella alexanderae TaxID=2877123 RepID=A0ABS7XUL6_9FLAO|nr:alpha,alpha-trehalase [Winogradskyella alexanderae]MCA0132506.1 trehalase [Winogradskyella alexanderae]
MMRVKIESTLSKLLTQEDTDGDKKITIEDKGPKNFELVSDSGESMSIKGTYQLSNLLQELVIQKQEGKDIADINPDYIDELPAIRISRMIRDYYWNGLTRKMDKSGIVALISDTKNASLTASILPVYVPYTDELAFDYYSNLETSLPIKTVRLPEIITPEYVKSINDKPGILSLKLEMINGEVNGVPFVVPGGRFNEMYGWDSYFEAVGLICDGKVHLAKAMADNFQYQIEHYGKILNANRSYYLTRTQPPFYSSLIFEVFEITKDKDWLTSHLKTAIKEYETVWMVKGMRLTKNGLNRYRAEGIGVTPESEEGHYDATLKPYAENADLTINEYLAKYQSGEIENEELDTYFLHDRSLRESGHDTSWRLDDVCADLNTVALNSLLYKYESDFAHVIETYFDGEFNGWHSAYWFQVMHERAERMQELMWNEVHGQYFDYNFVKQEQTLFESASNYFPLWAGLVDSKEAHKMVKTLMQQLKERGGIAGTSKSMNANLPENAMQRQWDYPNGWAPHQMLIWRGLKNYGFTNELKELVYRWLYMITRNAVDYNGTIPEKYDVVAATHKVFAEYGNVGTDFEYITQEGFGWMNASYQYGLTLLDNTYLNHLNSLVDPEELF